MLKNHVVNALKELYTEEDVRVILPAILQNSLICDELNHGGFNKIISTLPKPLSVSMWNLATIALASQGFEINLIQELKTKKTSDINSEITGESAKTFERFLIQKDFAPSLKNAIYIAIFLNDQFKDAGMFNEDINKNINFKDVYRGKNLEFWGCVFACLIKFQNNPKNLLEKLIMQLKNNESIEIITCAILSNPLSSQELIDLFVHVFSNQKLISIIRVLNYLNQYGWLKICRGLSGEIIKKHPELCLHSGEIEKSLKTSDWKDIPNITSKMQQIALLHYYAGMNQDASELFDVAKKLLKKQNEVLERITNEINNPSLHDNQFAELISSSNLSNHDGQLSLSEIERLIANDQIDEAAKQITGMRKTQKANPIFYRTSAEINYRLGGFSRALDEIIIAISIEPNDKESKIIAGRIYHTMDEYEKGFNLINSDSQILKNISMDDLFLFLELAIRTNNYEVVISICEEEIKKQESSQLFSFLAEAQIGLRQNQQALNSLKNAVEIDKSNSFAWVLLSKLEINSGEINKAIEALLTGIKYCPKSQKLYIELLKICLSQKCNSSIDRYLDIALSLSPESIKDVVELTRLVYQNKSEGDAIGLVDKANQKWPLNYQLKILYAELLLEASMFEESVNLLRELMQTHELDEEGLQLYFFALIGSTKTKFPFNNVCSFCDLPEIKQVVEILQDLNPESRWLYMFNAEVAYRENDIDEAIKIYSDLLKRGENIPQDMRWRIQAGMARLQMNKGEYGSAIILLRETINIKNDLPEIYLILTDAYEKEGLVNNVYETAIEIIKLFPLTQKIMSWFKTTLIRIGKLDIAISDIENSNLFNNEKELLILFISWQNENVNLARELIYKFMAGNSLKSNQVIIVANLLVEIGDTDKAIEILLYAKDDCCVEKNLINFLLACLQRKSGRLAEAITFLNNSFHRVAETYRSYLRLEMAIFMHDEEKIEQTVKEIEKKPVTFSPDFEELLDSINIKSEFFPESWREIIIKPETILAKAAVGYYRSGNFYKSMEMLEKAKAINPENIKNNWLFAEISRSFLLNFNDVNMTIDLNKYKCDEKEKEYLVNLSCLKAENALLRNEDILAASIISKVLPDNEENLRLKCMQARLLYREGDLGNAQRLLKEVENEIIEITHKKKGEEDYILDYSWLIAGAIDLGDWDFARNQVSIALKSDNPSLLVILMAIKCLCMIEINNDLCQAVCAMNHLVETDIYKKEIFSIIDNHKSLVIYENPIIHEWISISRFLEKKSWDKLGISVNYQNAEILAYVSRKNDRDELFKSIISQFNDNPGVLLQATIKNYGINLRESLDYVDKSISINPNNPISFAMRALIFEKNNKTEEALIAIENAIAFWSNEPEWHAMAAKLHGKMRNNDMEISHLEFAHQLHPHNPETRNKLMRKYIESGDLDKSVKLIDENEDVSSYTFDELLVLAEINLRNHFYKETYELVMEAIRKESGSSQPYILLARMAIELKNYKKAQEYLEKVFASSRENTEAHLLMAKMIEENRGIGEALNYLDNNFQGTHNESVIVKKAEYIKAISGTDESRKYLMQFDNLEIPSILTNLALMEIELGLYDEAEQHAQSSLNKSFNQPILISSLGAIYYKQGNLDKSLSFYLDALNLEPNSIKHYFNLSEIYLLRRETINAIDILRKGIEKFPNEIKLYQEAGKIYWSIKDYRRAEEMFRCATEINPDDDEARRQLGALMSINIIQQKQEVS